MYNGISLGETAIWEFIIQQEEREKDKENSISYRFVKPEIGTGYYLADDMLFFAYDNRTNEIKLNYEVFGENDFNHSISNLPDISLNKGINKIDIAVEDLGDLELNTNYVLKITDKIGAHYYFKFKYKG